MRNRRLLGICLFLLVANTASAQSTVFTYQGKLTDGVSAANGQGLPLDAARRLSRPSCA